MKPTKDSILRDIHELGIRHGDTVHVLADLLKVGYFEKSREYTLRAWIDILLEAVGEKGTITIAAYNGGFLRFTGFMRKNRFVFDRYCESDSGALSKAFVNDERAVRSKHPTNSIVGIGFNAHRILDSHDHNALSYAPAGEIIKLKGKNLLLGTVDSRNFPPLTFHYSEECLGVTLRHPLSGFTQQYFRDDEGNIRLFTRYGLGGCTRNFINLFGSFIANDAVKFGYIGRGRSAVIDMKKSFDIIYDLMKENWNYFRCSDPRCLSCHGRGVKKVVKVPVLYAKTILGGLRNRLMKIYKN